MKNQLTLMPQPDETHRGVEIVVDIFDFLDPATLLTHSCITRLCSSILQSVKTQKTANNSTSQIHIINPNESDFRYDVLSISGA